MITVISATNRTDSNTEVVAAHYASLLKIRGVDAKLFSLKSLPQDFLSSEMYSNGGDKMKSIVDDYIVGADKIVFIIPEYNGSYPGVLKIFLDGVNSKLFSGKKAGIIGLSNGHSGNLRGQEHLTSVLHYLRMMVHYLQPKLSNISQSINESAEIVDERTLRLLNEHAEGMIQF